MKTNPRRTSVGDLFSFAKRSLGSSQNLAMGILYSLTTIFTSFKISKLTDRCGVPPEEALHFLTPFKPAYPKAKNCISKLN
jgi:hypothetical protein